MSEAPATMSSDLPVPAPWHPRAWVAVVLSILLPGLGHLYAGRPLRGLVLLVALHVFAVAAILLALGAPGAVLRIALFVLLFVIGASAAPVDAARMARRAAPGRKRMYQRWYALAAVWLVATVIGPDWFIGFVKRNVAEAFKIPTGSMNPTLLAGDYVLVSHRVPEPLQRGTVVVYYFDEKGTHYTHRAVGVPGDTLEMRDFRLYRNGKPADEPWAHSDSGAPDPAGVAEFEWQRSRTLPGGRASPSYGNWGPLVVPQDSVFVLGDDRNHSLDSRFRGFVPRSHVVATPAWIYFSRDPESGEIRWERIGQRVQ